MKITITATALVTTVNGVPARLWEGVTENGTECKVYVAQIAVHAQEDSSQFERELQEIPPPREVSILATLDSRIL